MPESMPPSFRWGRDDYKIHDTKVVHGYTVKLIETHSFWNVEADKYMDGRETMLVDLYFQFELMYPELAKKLAQEAYDNIEKYMFLGWCEG